MDMYKRYKSALGYELGDDGIDSYGVDHNGFSTRDEVAYQFARDKREGQLLDYYQNQGVNDNYPQYGTDFWGSATENNYGFGSSDIEGNINHHPAMKQTPFPKMDQNAGYDWNANNDPQTENQTPTPWNNYPESHSETASGNQTLMPWDKNFDLKSYLKNYKNYISDEDLYAKMWENIKQHEDVIPHPYLDTKGKITIGGGANVNDWNVFKNLNATVDDMPATEVQKRAAYGRMRQLSDERDINGNYVNRNLNASAFKDKTSIHISDDEARNMAQDHMTNDLKHLRGEFSDFDDFPLPLKEVLLDIQYNVRNGVNAKDWPNLYQAIHNRDVNGIIDNVNRKDVGQDRNDWAEKKARSIRF